MGKGERDVYVISSVPDFLLRGARFIDSVRFHPQGGEKRGRGTREGDIYIYLYIRVHNGCPGRDHVIGILWSVSNRRNYVQWNKVEKLVIDVSI